MTTATENAGPFEELRPHERFELWRDLLALTRDCDASTSDTDRFSAELRRSELGPVTFLGTSFPSARFRRTDARVRRSDPGVFHLTFVQRGVLALSRDAEQTQLFRPGELTMLDSSRAYDLRALGERAAAGGEPRVEGVGIDFPVALLPTPPFRLRRLLGRGFRATGGPAAVLADFLVSLDRQAALLGPAVADRLGPIAVDLVAAWLADELEDDADLPDTARQRATVEQVRTFVRRHLHDPELTPSTIAAAHHISVSYLHRLFAQHTDGDTVAAWIRRLRLEKAHRDLADPALRTVPIGTIAARCGIPRPDDFSRAFRTAYGLAPRDHRQQSLSLKLTPRQPVVDPVPNRSRAG
ncbi:helix-turn-helix domain-containing protein [Kitasatospora sp. NPDC059646]|uniref:helix-turn-helix domain-containing protein n=1 Tax=Kitasatospora sp. NPDC059646 TaxID=3346893 RepID=UPI00368817BA